MAVDKLVDSTQLDADLTSVADAIRTKGGTSAQLAFPAGFVSAIDAIPTGGGGEWTTEGIAVGSEPAGDIIIDTTGNLSQGAFAYNRAITTAVIKNCGAFANSLFEGCSALKRFVISKAFNSGFGNYVFRNCPSLREIIIPLMGAAGGFGGYGLSGNTSLKLIDYGSVNQAQFNGLPACPLDTVIIRKANGIATLPSNALNNSLAFKSGGTGGKVYVPSAYLDQYPVATNWSVYYGYGTMQFFALEGSQYEDIGWWKNTPIE